MLIPLQCVLFNEQVSQNLTSSIFSTLSLQARLKYTLEQKLEDLQSLNLNQFASAEYDECENLDDNLLADLGFNRFDNFPEYVREYATIIIQQPNRTTSITRIKTAIEELKEMLAKVVESTLTFSALVMLRESELEILCQLFFAFIDEIEKDYSLVGILYKNESVRDDFSSSGGKSNCAAGS